MGIGDEIIASGHARTIAEKSGKRVMICDRYGRGRWSGVWEGLEWIAHPTKDHGATDFVRIPNGARCRPYIDYRKGFTRALGLNYSGWRVRDHRGAIALTGKERAFADDMAKALGPFVIVEPLVKEGSNPNKQWPRPRWQALASTLAKSGTTVVQLGPNGTSALENVKRVITPDFRFAAAMLTKARWSYLPDGGLHHAAAALGLANVTVLWGGANDPEVLGYPEHLNIYFPTACRNWRPCAHCRTIWNWITPEMILDATKKERFQ